MNEFETCKRQKRACASVRLPVRCDCQLLACLETGQLYDTYTCMIKHVFENIHTFINRASSIEARTEGSAGINEDPSDIPPELDRFHTCCRSRMTLHMKLTASSRTMTWPSFPLLPFLFCLRIVANSDSATTPAFAISSASTGMLSQCHTSSSRNFCNAACRHCCPLAHRPTAEACCGRAECFKRPASNPFGRERCAAATQPWQQLQQ